MPDQSNLPKMLIHTEVETLLRRSRAHVTRLRLERKLAYYSGRPVTVDEKHLQAFVARAKRWRRRRIIEKEKLKTGRPRSVPEYLEVIEYVVADAVPGPFSLLTFAEAAAKYGRTRSQIKYLCLHGRVPYLPGRRALIDDVDIASYFEQLRAAELAKIPPVPGTLEFRTLQHQRVRDQARSVHRAKAALRAVRLYEKAKQGREQQ
jgi:hypothetical protein